ncbi:MAG: DALR domain-containing protein, partial [Patescibacteria group bacterium]
ESASGKKPFVKLWMHVEFLSVNGEKMSKSLHNYITLTDFLSEHSANAFRWIVLMHHYRERMNFTDKTIEAAEKNLEDISIFLGKLAIVAKRSSNKKSVGINIAKFGSDLNAALEDDFNTPKALAAIFNLMNDISPRIWSFSRPEANKAYKLLSDSISMFGIDLKLPKIPAKISKLALEREKLRGSKQFIKSDTLRKEINGLGYTVEDTELGPFVWPKNHS